MSAESSRAARPGAVEAFDEALAEWLASFTVPQELAAEMAASCSSGAPWAAALAGTSVRRAGWPEPEALAWGIAVGALAGALEAGRRSLEGSPATGAGADAGNGPERRGAAAGPALPLLAADGLLAAAHEALASLEPERLATSFAALESAFGDGGPWKYVSANWPRPAWPTVVACGLAAAATEDPQGPWAEAAESWRAAFGAPDEFGERPTFADDALEDQTASELFAAAALAAGDADPEGHDDGRF